MARPVRPIPEGYHAVTPYLIIDGAAQAYELAYDKEQHILLVSLGDGHQLFAFGEE